MSFLNKLTARIPFGKKEEVLEYFFALNIANEYLSCALWTIEKKQLKVLEVANEKYSSIHDLTKLTDKLLDTVLGVREIEPQKILFGIPSSWLASDNLKDEYLKVIRGLVKELDLKPMAYVENSHALVHFLEKTDGVPPTAILVRFETRHLTITVVRAGKLDGVKVVLIGENMGTDIEKTLLTFTDVETLPSKILIYTEMPEDLEKLKNELLSFSWMSKLSFLHFPKIEILSNDIEIKSVCLAGASEIENGVLYEEAAVNRAVRKEKDEKANDEKQEANLEKVDIEKDLGFVVGDVSEENQNGLIEEEVENDMVEKKELVPSEESFAIEDFEKELASPSVVPMRGKAKGGFSFKLIFLGTIIGALLIILGAYLLLFKAEVKIFVEPKILEKDTQVVADPNQKTVDENTNIIPGQLVDTDVSGTAKDSATGKRQIGNAAKGTVKIINNTSQGQNFSKGTILTTSSGLKFILDNTASVSATLTDADSKSTVTVPVSAQEIGADGNIPTQTNLNIANFSASQFIAKAEGNFSGGTSQEVTVVSSDDQQKLLASLASDLKKQAQQKLQEKLPQKKILEEALSEEITKKSFSKNINDQASEFSLNLTAKYKGTAFEDKDLKLIVSKLVTTQVPTGFELNLEDTETQADVSKLEKGGKVIFLARFKAKLIPKIDVEKVISQIKGKGIAEAINSIKGMENILGSEIKISPSLPSILQRLPILSKNIKVEVGLK